MVRAIFGRKWKSLSTKLANILAVCTGLRAGEIQGLRKCDLGESCLYVKHSCNLADGSKIFARPVRKLEYKNLAMLELYANHRKPEDITMLKIARKKAFEPLFGNNSK